MAVTRGFYRHYKGHVYFVHGVACDPHDNHRRLVIYTSVKTEEVGTEGQPKYDFLARDEKVFEEWVDAWNGQVYTGEIPDTRYVYEGVESFGASNLKVVRRFQRLTKPDHSVL